MQKRVEFKFLSNDKKNKNIKKETEETITINVFYTIESFCKS